MSGARSEGCGGEMCYRKCLKIFISMINVIVFLLGLSCSTLSGYTIFDANSYLRQQLVKSSVPELLTGAYIIFATGLILSILSLIGLWGSCKGSKRILVFYAACLLVMFVIHLAGTTVFFLQLNNIENFLVRELRRTPNITQVNHSYAGVFLEIENVQKNMNCCGIRGPEDYGSNILPESCYALPAKKPSESAKSSSDSAVTPKVGALTPEVAISTHQENNENNSNHFSVAETKAPHNLSSEGLQSEMVPFAKTTTAESQQGKADTTANPKKTTKGPKLRGSVYTQGCETAALNYVYAAGGVSIALLFFEVLLMILCLLYFLSLKNNYRTV